MGWHVCGGCLQEGGFGCGKQFRLCGAESKKKIALCASSKGIWYTIGSRTTMCPQAHQAHQMNSKQFDSASSFWRAHWQQAIADATQASCPCVKELEFLHRMLQEGQSYMDVEHILLETGHMAMSDDHQLRSHPTASPQATWPSSSAVATPGDAHEWRLEAAQAKTVDLERQLQATKDQIEEQNGHYDEELKSMKGQLVECIDAVYHMNAGECDKQLAVTNETVARMSKQVEEMQQTMGVHADRMEILKERLLKLTEDHSSRIESLSQEVKKVSSVSSRMHEPGSPSIAASGASEQWEQVNELGAFKEDIQMLQDAVKIIESKVQRFEAWDW